MNTPDIISVQVTHTEEIAANRVDMLVTIRGSSLVSGASALRKAREVRQLVQALEAIGLPESAVELREVQADVSNGLLASSSARYQLRIRCQQLDQLADLIGVISSQKQASLTALRWRYPDDEAAQHGWLRQCLERANQRAQVMAGVLGVAIVGVHKATSNYHANDPHETPFRMPAAKSSGISALRGAAVTSAELGLTIQHRKTVAMQVDVEYRIDRYQPGDAPA